MSERTIPYAERLNEVRAMLGKDPKRSVTTVSYECEEAADLIKERD